MAGWSELFVPRRRERTARHRVDGPAASALAVVTGNGATDEREPSAVVILARRAGDVDLMPQPDSAA